MTQLRQQINATSTELQLGQECIYRETPRNGNVSEAIVKVVEIDELELNRRIKIEVVEKITDEKIPFVPGVSFNIFAFRGVSNTDRELWKLYYK